MLYFSEPYAPQNLIANANINSMCVSWNKPILGRVERYYVYLRDVTYSKKEVPGSGNNTETFDGLTSGKEYTVAVVAVSGHQRSDSLNGTFFTST